MLASLAFEAYAKEAEQVEDAIEKLKSTSAWLDAFVNDAPGMRTLLAPEASSFLNALTVICKTFKQDSKFVVQVLGTARDVFIADLELQMLQGAESISAFILTIGGEASHSRAAAERKVGKTTLNTGEAEQSDALENFVNLGAVALTHKSWINLAKQVTVSGKAVPLATLCCAPHIFRACLALQELQSIASEGKEPNLMPPHLEVLARVCLHLTELKFDKLDSNIVELQKHLTLLSNFFQASSTKSLREWLLKRKTFVDSAIEKLLVSVGTETVKKAVELVRATPVVKAGLVEAIDVDAVVVLANDMVNLRTIEKNLDSALANVKSVVSRFRNFLNFTSFEDRAMTPTAIFLTVSAS